MQRDGRTMVATSTSPEVSLAEVVEETRRVLEWLEYAYAWFLDARELTYAQLLYQVIAGWSEDRQAYALAVLQAAQAEAARSLTGGS